MTTFSSCVARARWGARAIGAMALIAASGIAGTRAEGQGLFTYAETLPDYSSYETPSRCLAAVKRVDLGDVKEVRPRPWLARPATVAVARRCGGRFTLQSVRETDLNALWNLAMAMGDDSLALQAVGRFVTTPFMGTTRSALERAQVLNDAVMKAIVPWARFATMRALAAEVDSLGSDPEVARLRFSSHFYGLLWATAIGDSAAVAEELEAAQAAIPHMSEGHQRGAALYLLGPAVLADLNVLRNHGLDSMLTAFSARISATAPELAGEAVRILGQPAPAPTADFWYQRPPGDSLLPRKGHVTAVLSVDAAMCATNCSEVYAALRRLKENFGDRLDVIVLQTKTHGYFKTLPPLAPRDEADALNHYLADFWFHDTPVIVGVTKTPFSRLPEPDRRRVDEQVKPPFPAPFAIVDQRGRLALAAGSDILGWLEAPLRQFIDILLQQAPGDG